MKVDNIYQRYDSNVYSSISSISQKSNAVFAAMKTVVTALSNFSNAVEQLINTTPCNNNFYSLNDLLATTLQCNNNITNSLTQMSKIYNNLNKSITAPWTWKEHVSDYDRLKKQQLQQILNIQSYRSLSLYLNDITQLYLPTIEMDLFDTKKYSTLLTISERLIQERSDQLAVSYNQPIENILQEEHRPPTMLPIGFEKIMYHLYYSPEHKDMEGVFRKCGGVDELKEYIDYIGIADFELADNILLSALIKKYFRETTKPIWPEELFDQLMGSTRSLYANKITLDDWKNNFKKIYMKVDTSHKTFIEYFIALCLKVINDPRTKMDVNGLAICISPGLFRRTGKDIEISDNYVYSTFETILKNANDLFVGLKMKFTESKKNEILHPSTFYSNIFNTKNEGNPMNLINLNNFMNKNDVGPLSVDKLHNSNTPKKKRNSFFNDSD